MLLLFYLNQFIMKKLPKKFKEKWIAALRSGDYIQTDSVLYNGLDNETGKPQMCCLGVACEIIGMNRNSIYKEGTPEDVKKIKNFDKLPSYIQQINQGMYDKKKDGGKLAQFNDHGKSFKWIASYIERYL